MKKVVFALIIFFPLLAEANDSDVRWRTIPYADLHDAFISHYLEGEYLRSHPAFQVRGRNFSIHDLRVEIDADQGTIILNIEEDGLADFPLDPALAAENPDVRTNAPQGGLGAAIRYSAEAKPVQVFSYSLIEEMMSEYRAAIRSQGLIARLSLPRPNGLLIRFDGPGAYASVLTAEGVRLEANEEGYLLIPRNKTWRELDPTIELSEIPGAIVLAFD